VHALACTIFMKQIIFDTEKKVIEWLTKLQPYYADRVNEFGFYVLSRKGKLVVKECVQGDQESVELQTPYKARFDVHTHPYNPLCSMFSFDDFNNYVKVNADGIMINKFGLWFCDTQRLKPLYSALRIKYDVHKDTDIGIVNMNVELFGLGILSKLCAT